MKNKKVPVFDNQWRMVIMTYEEAREFIDQSNQYGSKLGLETITELLNRIGNPQEQLKVIHVAGTNGKGSTTAFIASILATEGYRVGRYISPAVFTYCERIQISQKKAAVGGDNVPVLTDYITESGVGKAMEIIKPACEAMVRDGFSHPTSFELETAMAMLYFVWEQVDFAVIEVGLGGRLDATNVIRKPICCVITSISMDHIQYLGDTLEKIAGEKAGIIKAGAPVVTGNKDPEVLPVLMQTCLKQKTNLIVAEASEATCIGYSVEGTTFRYGNDDYSIRLLGEYQVENAVLAIETARVIRGAGYPISDNSIKCGLKMARWKGRFEIIAREPYFIIDGAHNEDAARQFEKTIVTYFSERRIIYIMGVLADKDYHSILKITAPLADAIIALTPNNLRALESSLLAKEARKYTDGKVIDAKTISRAVDYAYQEAGKEDVIIAFGSLSYLGELSQFLTERYQQSD
jgi:dihydrofolate synthase / folylpolyglutamate synthase